ncbi:hypothetical protein GOODEAATRI_000723 [Goodea atripinnis]|uniref:Mitochondrial fission regulator n=1 Tax=Goodea atripinnis TaxID=208336 RepID=A0ABV0MN82_9TELE
MDSCVKYVTSSRIGLTLRPSAETGALQSSAAAGESPCHVFSRGYSGCAAYGPGVFRCTSRNGKLADTAALSQLSNCFSACTIVPVWETQLCGQYRSIVRMIGTNLPLKPTPRVHFQIPLVTIRPNGYTEVAVDTPVIPTFADVMWVFDYKGESFARTRYTQCKHIRRVFIISANCFRTRKL